MKAPNWTTPEQIRAQVQRLWDDGRLLAARLNGEALFPLTLAVRQPNATELAQHFDAVRGWIRALEEGARTVKTHGYDIVWRDINHRQLGRNRLPAQCVFNNEDDALRLIGRLADARRFDALAASTLRLFPHLRSWLGRRALVVLEQASAWERMLLILQWCVTHPRPGLYVRQLDIAGVDSKFIEVRKALLAELLDQLLPPEVIDTRYAGARQFEARYGLLSKPALLRFRMLDRAYDIGGLSDLTVPVAQFASLEPAVQRIYITENEINFLAFPDAASSMVIFGGGYGIDRLADVAWLAGKDVVYWGDIDTHGFAILDRLRGRFPQTRSMLMDVATLHAHRALWGSEDEDKRYIGDLARLTESEGTLFNLLRDNVLGARVRMEQERLGYTWVKDAIANL